jgi:hypothetical protein
MGTISKETNSWGNLKNGSCFFVGRMDAVVSDITDLAHGLARTLFGGMLQRPQ